MKTSQIFLFALLGGASVWAQTNTFPTTGDVGIGTTTPTAKLHVLGQNVHFFSNTGANTLEIGRDNIQKFAFNVQDYDAYMDLLQDSDSNRGHIMYFRNLAQGTSPDNDIRFQTSSVDRLSIKANGNVGIGIMEPETPLHIYEGTSNGFRDVSATSIIEGTDARLQLMSSNAGNNGSSILLTNETSSWALHQKTSTSGNRFDIGYRVSNQIEDIPSLQSVYLSIFNDGDVGIGTTDTKGFKLGVNGKIAATEVKVAAYTNWADFVFEKDYDLPTLEEVEKHIRDKGHLKDIPSAEEVSKNGIFLGEMDSRLLQKIEELTLYTIAQEKRIKHLEKENDTLKFITERVSKIEALVKAE